MKTSLIKTGYCLFAAFMLFISTASMAHSSHSLSGNPLPGKVASVVAKPFSVSLLYFRGQYDPKGLVRLNWATASEVNNNYFVIERSTDGEDFRPIAEISSKKGSTRVTLYNYADFEPIKVVTYYKLIQVDRDGNSTELGVLEVSPDGK